MRKLTGHDVFMALRFVKTVGVKDELVEFATVMRDRRNGETEREIGARLVLGLLSNCGDEIAEKAFFAFLAGPLETSIPDLQNMELMELCKMVSDLIVMVNPEEWRAFFKSLVGALHAS